MVGLKEIKVENFNSKISYHMQYHHNAKTNIQQRKVIKETVHKISSRDLADRFQVSHVTITKWRKVEHLEDKSSKPKTIYYALSEAEQKIIRKVRKRGLFSLDDLLISLSPYIEKLNRTNCWRTLKRYRLNRFSVKEKKEGKRFANYLPGFLHIDLFYLPKIKESRKKKRYYCFLAIDRTTKLVFLEVYPRRTQQEAADFLVKCLEFFPYRIHHILTDNGKEFTLKGMRNRWGKIKAQPLFDLICEWLKIKHRTTKPYHPWTNGQAEIMVRIAKNHTTRVHHYQNISETIKNIKRFQDAWNYYKRLKVLQGKMPYEVTCEWFKKKPEIFLRDPTILIEKNSP